MATAGTIPLFNTDPNVQAQAALLQQRQALAQALLQQGLASDNNNYMAGNIAYRVSPLAGVAKALQTYAGIKGQQNAIQQQAQLAAQAYGNLLSKYQPGGTPQFTPDQINAAEVSGKPADQMGPPDPMKMAAYLQGQTPTGGPNPNNPQGIPAQILAAHDAGMMNDKAFEVLTAPYKPTDATLAATQGGFSVPGANQTAFQKSVTDPKIWAMTQAGLTPEQIRLATIGEAAKNADITRRPDQMFENFVTGERGVVPKIPEGANPVGVPAANGAVPGVAPMPGAAPIIQQNSQANATGSANGSIRDVTLPGGRVVPARGSEIPPLASQVPPAQDADRVAIYTQEMNQARQRLASAKTPEDKARAQGDIDALTRETQRLGIKLGQSTQDKVTQETNAKTLAELPAQIPQIKQTITGLENAYNVAARSGPGVSRSAYVTGILNNLGLPVMKDDTQNFQTLKKFLENSASAAASAGGFTGSDARFEQFRAGQPNADTMNPDALRGAIRYVLSQHDAALARAQFITQQSQANAGDPNAVQKAQQQWSQIYNPRVFEFSRMTPQEQQAVVKGMDSKALQQFRQQYNAANQMGWVR